ncbi:putative modified peptide [Pseudoduganella sp. FT25W]|jgi:putative modified peptide|uniref:Putative modified peptide n=1 Tax=Duganella alba TaxID=2666081 RepID=A0A6L5QM31_9BURK|nr:NHLP-related RiPP peptide [Duganella alba]MRX10332.1 putative modified peptide [Duganella alba]MRX20042.1 putative modified peptide [Duganella alba]
MHTSNELSSILDKLASDDKFRAQLQANPVATLARFGITLSADQVPDQISLPSKEELTEERHELQRELETTGIMFPFLLSGTAVAA